MGRLVDAFPDDVLVVYRHFPLNQIHPNAQKSAEASEVAGAQGAFWSYHDLLYERQSEWSQLEPDQARQFFIDLASELELDVDKFTADLDGGVYADYVTAQEQEAIALGLPGTPSAIVNSEIVGGGIPIDYTVWENFVKSMIAVAAIPQWDEPPEMALEEGKSYKARVKMENGGEFLIELYPESAPLTVNSFVFLANEGFFDGVTFHRVLDGFVAQTGDPSGTGMGGPGYMLPNEIDPQLSHDDKGVVAMANRGPDTNGSGWYVTLGPAVNLDGGYTIFGRVIEGMEVVENITLRDPASNPDAPPGDVMESVTIEITD
jgi:cyclophilin family peptidyl-prolyl cis-trans isomerase